MKTDLSKLYRGLTAASAAGHDPVPHAHHLTQLVSGEMTPEDRDEALDRVSKSALESDLLRFALALEPASQELSRSLAALSQQEGLLPSPSLVPAAGIRTGWGKGHSTRRAITKRTFLGAGIAAAFALVLMPLQPRHEAGIHIQAQRAASDQIFTWSSSSRPAHQVMGSTSAADEIFRADFKEDG